MGGLGGMGAMNPQEMMNNPELMNQMMENPLVRQMMDVSLFDIISLVPILRRE